MGVVGPFRAVGVPAGQPPSSFPPKTSRKGLWGLDVCLPTGDFTRCAPSWKEVGQDRSRALRPGPPPRRLHTLPAIHRFTEPRGPAASPGHSPAAPAPQQGVRGVKTGEAALHRLQGAGARFPPDPAQTQDWGDWCPAAPLPPENQALRVCGLPSPLLRPAPAPHCQGRDGTRPTLIAGAPPLLGTALFPYKCRRD